MKKRFYLSILLFVLLSCGISMGDRIDNGNVSVYYLETISQKDAIAFARYWRDNGFVGERKQTIQLDQKDNVIFIKLIERETYSEDPIDITEEAMLQDLERELRDKLFHKDVRIVITDNTFRPILKRNT